MLSLLDRLTRTLVRNGLRRGLAGDGKWLAIGAVAWLVRFLMKKREPKTVTETLARGERIVVSNLGPPPRHRAARKREEAARSRTPIEVGTAT